MMSSSREPTWEIHEDLCPPDSSWFVSRRVGEVSAISGRFVNLPVGGTIRQHETAYTRGTEACLQKWTASAHTTRHSGRERPSIDSLWPPGVLLVNWRRRDTMERNDDDPDVVGR